MTNTQTLNANALHQTRIGYTWKRTEQVPLSTEPSLQVAGYFTGGGSTSGSLNNWERDLEIDDDLTLTHGKHELKIGVQSLGILIHDYDPNTFNGAFVFGGRSAPVLDANNNPTDETETITPIEQYRRALLNLPGGTQTTMAMATLMTDPPTLLLLVRAYTARGLVSCPSTRLMATFHAIWESCLRSCIWT